MPVFTDLQSIGTTIDSGDAYLAAFKYENAVAAYQTAAGQGQTLKQEIPAHLWPPTADGINAQLESLQEHLASQATAQQAQSLAKQLFGLYQAAVAAMPTPPSTAVTPATPATAAPSMGNAVAIAALWGVVALGIGYLGYLIFRGPRENPVAGKAEKAKPAKRHLIAKGRACRFDMKDGSSISARGGMLHDPSGRYWPRNSILIGPFRPRRRKVTDEEYRGSAVDYLGRRHKAYVGSIDTPPKSLAGWTYEGEVETLWYTRGGTKARGRFYHDVNGHALSTAIKGRGKIRLYRRGRFYRLQLPRGAILDSRGYVWP